MNQSFHLKTTTLAVRNWVSPATAGRGFLLVALALAWFALSHTVKAQDGDEGNGNTAEGLGALGTYISTASSASFDTAIGHNALFNDTTGSNNTATGAQALNSNTTGGGNTATGLSALFNNTTGSSNTATGAFALELNTTGVENTATGLSALDSNTTGSGNTATGVDALGLNTTGFQNTADGLGALVNNNGDNNTAAGFNALTSNTTGNNNTATGLQALKDNTAGIFNTANGEEALFSNKTGNNNTADGVDALFNNTTGKSNIGLGFNAGINLTTGSNNIDIGNGGVAGESAKIRIGTGGTQKAAFIAGIHGVAVTGAAVVVNTSGQLGVTSSSARFKEGIKPMDKASEAILALKPVTFHYKKEVDPDGIPQFGLVAEQVEKVNPDLVARDADGKVYSVRYEAVNAMLLNEFLKEHRKVQEQETTIAQLKKGMEAVTARLKEQDSKIQAVNERLERATSLQVVDTK